MVIDTSAVVAILFGEPEGAAYATAIEQATTRLVSAVTRVELACVIEGRKGEAGHAMIERFLELADIEVSAVTPQQAMAAIEGFRNFGKGRDRAALSIGDCFSYALAKSASQPLLFKGRDFAQTDIEPAIRPERNSYSAVSTKSVKASPASQPNPSSSGESADHIAAVRRLPLSGA